MSANLQNYILITLGFCVTLLTSIIIELGVLAHFNLYGRYFDVSFLMEPSCRVRFQSAECSLITHFLNPV